MQGNARKCSVTRESSCRQGDTLRPLFIVQQIFPIVGQVTKISCRVILLAKFDVLQARDENEECYIHRMMCNWFSFVTPCNFTNFEETVLTS